MFFLVFKQGAFYGTPVHDLPPPLMFFLSSSSGRGGACSGESTLVCSLLAALGRLAFHMWEVLSHFFGKFGSSARSQSTELIFSFAYVSEQTSAAGKILKVIFALQGKNRLHFARKFLSKNRFLCTSTLIFGWLSKFSSAIFPQRAYFSSRFKRFC